MQRATIERIENVVFGLSFFGWAVANVFAEEQASLVRFAIAGLHFCAGCLIIFRAPTQRNGSWRDLATCLPGLISAGLVFRLAGPVKQWPLIWSILFVVATIWSILSLLALGKSFAVFPSLRETRTRGPYALVRHPAYMGEVGMMICCVAVANSALAWLCLAFAIATIALRIVVEERLLLSLPAYQEYSDSVRYRLLPYIW